METNTYKKRTRVNVSTSVKGIITPDVTVEMIDATNEEVIAEVTSLYKEAQIKVKEMMNNE
jgi:hypothetical protein